jgi:hypothetical protein
LSSIAVALRGRRFKKANQEQEIRLNILPGIALGGFRILSASIAKYGRYVRAESYQSVMFFGLRMMMLIEHRSHENDDGFGCPQATAQCKKSLAHAQAAVSASRCQAPYLSLSPPWMLTMLVKAMPKEIRRALVITK